ncbi:MAG: ribonuclease III [Patescibacteria group bacterium]
MDPGIKKRLLSLQYRLGVEFNNLNLLLQAMTHRSYLNEHRSHPVAHNEILEFLGDAVIELVVTEFLSRKYLNKADEGTLTKWRSCLVSGETCCKVAEKLELADCLLVGYGKLGETARQRMLADSFEAVIGALYLDQGLGAVRLVMDAHLLVYFSSSTIEGTVNFLVKSRLLELVQRIYKIAPKYELLVGPSDDRHAGYFQFGVFVGGKLIGKGCGKTKRQAKEAAAKNALENL